MSSNQNSKYRERRPFNPKLESQTRDYWKTHRDPRLLEDDPQAAYAVYLPATSSNYVFYCPRERMTDFGIKANGYQPGQRVPVGFTNSGDELNYYQKDSGGFYYGAGLYSSGHATLDINKTIDREFFIHERDPQVTMLGDSGGFQWATGTWKTNWEDTASINKVRETVLRWLELTADYSMVLDFPANGILLNPDFPSFHSMMKRKFPGIDEFNACLEFTLENIRYFLDNHVPGATKFLNVIQGATPDQALGWYDRVKDVGVDHPGFFGGWALAGNITLDYASSLRLMIRLRDEKKINENQHWIHMLGLSRISNAPLLTKIQRILRQQVHPSITISFDSSSPFLSASKALAYARSNMTAKKFSTVSVGAPDDKNMVGSNTSLAEWFRLNHGVVPTEYSSIAQRLTLGDMCVKGLDIDSNSSWDTITYMFLMNHNTELMIRGIQEANRICDGAYVNGQEWHQEGGECPPDLYRLLNDIIPEIFDSENPMNTITKYQSILTAFNTRRFVPNTLDQTAMKLFDFGG
jgi:hypothetical protein